jgi:hypothetical protein
MKYNKFLSREKGSLVAFFSILISLHLTHTLFAQNNSPNQPLSSNPSNQEQESSSTELDNINQDSITPNSESSVTESNNLNINDNNHTNNAVMKYDFWERGVLEDGDDVISSDNSLYDSFEWQGKKGELLNISLESNDFDTYLAVQAPSGKIIAENDDIDSENSNSLLSVTLPEDGLYRLIVNSYNQQGRGTYTITIKKGN